MAVISRVTAAALTGVAVVVTMVNPALGYWRASGNGKGTVATATAAARIITLTLAKQGNSVRATGTAGYTSPYNAAITVVLCRDNIWPCPTGRAVLPNLTATAAAGTPSYTVTSGNLNGTTVYGQASQLQNTGWKDYSAVPAPVTP